MTSTLSLITACVTFSLDMTGGEIVGERDMHCTVYTVYTYCIHCMHCTVYTVLYTLYREIEREVKIVGPV